MVAIDTLEGTIDGTLWYHYDVASDVLYLRLRSHQDRDAVGEETDDGFILLRDAETQDPVGLTVVSWWERFGSGPLPDSIGEIHKWIEPWAEKLAA
ncbi:MAG: hypothetical protein HY718_21155 [Planctomycetes bacterium]|nr:hypothetical protein [Planctomycetota bacterium]